MRLPPILLLALLLPGAPAVAQRFFEREPNRYHKTTAENAATALNRRLLANELELRVEGPRGRLRALLQALGVPESSQTLVFSKTSLQRHRVSPHNPRAIYFGPDAYVGWIPGSAAIEVAVGDAHLGLVFYTLSQDPGVAPQLTRDDSCLSCHAGSRTDDEPGLLLRSVFPDEDGNPIASAGETDVTFRTPIAERWGGWLVTGQFQGDHRGNGLARRDEDGRWGVPNQPATDLSAFAADFAADVYPVPSSDIGALLVLEQQVTVHNLLIRASLQMRCLLEYDRVLNAALGESGVRESTARIADRLARTIAEAMLLGDEPPLAAHEAAPSAAFAADFARLWPRAGNGPALGELDLRQRTFVLPLSPMVHSPAFAALPAELHRRVLERLHVALDRGTFPGGVTMTTAQRSALRLHLQASLPGW